MIPYYYPLTIFLSCTKASIAVPSNAVAFASLRASCSISPVPSPTGIESPSDKSFPTKASASDGMAKADRRWSNQYNMSPSKEILL